MKLPLTNCPTCNSVQAFARHARVVEEQIETYICCRMCKTETILKRQTRRERLTRRRQTRERQKVR